MLEQFDKAVRGMKVGESKTFPLQFPGGLPRQGRGRQGGRLPGHVKKIEAAAPARGGRGLAKSLGIKDGTVDGLRADVKKNLEREVKFRVLARNKAAVMDALVAKAELDLPKAAGDSRSGAPGRRRPRRPEAARRQGRRQGPDSRRDVPARRPSAACAWAWWWPNWCVPMPAGQARAAAGPHRGTGQSYEKPAEVMRWYLGDRQRMAEVEAVVIENNVTDHVLGKAKVRQGARSTTDGG
jgi:trigger factor